MIFSYLLIGAVAGTLAGVFGVGGGVVVVPILAAIFDYNDFPQQLVMQFATGTSLAIMVVTSLSSLRAHTKLGHNIMPIFERLLPGLILGVIAGAFLENNLDSSVLRFLLGMMLLIIAYRAFFVINPVQSENIPSTLIMSLSSFVLGAVSGMLGIGGGALLISLLLYFNVDIRLAIAVSTGCAFVIAVVGTAVYMYTGSHAFQHIPWTTGYVYWPAFIGIALSSPVFVKLGANLSKRLPTLYLRRLFSFIILLAAIKLLVY